MLDSLMTIDHTIRKALEEDLGAGDLTTDAIIDTDIELVRPHMCTCTTL